ncbi:MAG: AI-2E family transporter [Epulopiscium sp.]|nr:AI-2E family transporter [Candidatus Epulonipiscium sp.]
MDKKTFKSILFLITYCILLVVMIVKIDVLIAIFTKTIGILAPLFIGFAIAFVLNKPYNFFLDKYVNAFSKKKWPKISKPLALTTVFLLFIGIISGIVGFIIPQLFQSINLVYENIGGYSTRLQNFAFDVIEYLRLDSIDLSGLETTIAKIPDMVGNVLKGIVPRVFDFTTSFISASIDIILGFILSIYLLADKENLKRQFADVLQAYVPVKFRKKLMNVLGITNEVFTSFVSGQLIEAMILALLCFAGMLIFNFQYPILISVIIGITNLIPIVGPIIGMIPALFILVMIEPIQALWFILFAVVLQQIEGNLIYPRVVGNSVGLPALWVMLAIIVGGGLFGILGMLLGVPTASVMYQLIKHDVNQRNQSSNS